jgi:L-methionine (R)-S-oxide reductase
MSDLAASAALDLPTDKAARYRALLPLVEGLLAGERDLVANAANLSALLWQALPDCNWIGFYFYKDGGLVVGPFQGKPACVRIALGQGVCGAAAASRRTQLVRDVHEFPGHIACDAASNAEVVIPLSLADGSLLGVLDLDSPTVGRFDATDAAGLEAIAARFLASLG